MVLGGGLWMGRQGWASSGPEEKPADTSSRQGERMNVVSFLWVSVKRGLRSSVFALFTLVVYSTMAVGQDFFQSCHLPRLPKHPQPPIHGRFDRLPDMPTLFDFAFLSVSGNGDGSAGGGGSESGSNGTPTPCKEISDLEAWFDRNLPDTTPPAVGNLTPTSGSSVDALTFVLSLDAQDENPLAFRVLEDNLWILCQTTQFYDTQTHKFTLHFPIQITPALITPAGYSLDRVWLAQGTRKVTVEVYDKAGNKSSLTATYEVNDPGVQQALNAIQSYEDEVNANIPESERAPLLADANLMRVMVKHGVYTYGDFANAIQQF
ncbi:MAG: hypothetical protein V2G48_06365 [bacterium JZ-2024 1]